MGAAVCKASPSSAAAVTPATMCAIRTGVAGDLAALLSSYSDLQKSRLFGSALRLVFHDAAEMSSDAADRLGADGCLSQSSDNAGLVEATSLAATVIESAWQKYCGQGISRADFWVLFAKLCAERSAALAKDRAQCVKVVDMLQVSVDVFSDFFLPEAAATAL